MKSDIDKLKDFVSRNEAYIESAKWLTDEINQVIIDYDQYLKTGTLAGKYSNEEDMFNKMLELDRRSEVEERVYAQLTKEQKYFSDGD